MVNILLHGNVQYCMYVGTGGSSTLAYVNVVIGLPYIGVFCSVIVDCWLRSWSSFVYCSKLVYWVWGADIVCG